MVTRVENFIPNPDQSTITYNTEGLMQAVTLANSNTWAQLQIFSGGISSAEPVEVSANSRFDFYTYGGGVGNIAGYISGLPNSASSSGAIEIFVAQKNVTLYSQAMFFGIDINGGPAYQPTAVSTANNTLDDGSSNVTIGGHLNLKTGSNKTVGQVVLVAGTATVSNTSVTANSLIFLTDAVPGGTVGFLSVGTITAGTSFVINSSSGTDTSTVNWLIIN